ncbi:MAG: type II secretion system protein GspL [Thermodesulfovibrionales bacterium]
MAFIDVKRRGDGADIPNYDYRVFTFLKRGREIAFLKETTLDDREIRAFDTYLLNLPSEILDFRLLQLPNIETQKLRQIVPFELEGKILVNRENLIFDVIKTQEEKDSLVVYMDKNELYRILQPLRQIGIIPQTITSTDIKRMLDEGFANFDLKRHQITDNEKIDLLSKEIATPTIQLKDKGIRGDEIRLAIIKPLFKMGLVILFFAVCWFLFRIYSNITVASEIRTTISSHYRGLFPEEKKITDEVYQLRSKIRVLEEKSDTLGGIDPLGILKNLSEAKIEGIKIHEISIEKGIVRLKGEAPKMDDIERFKGSMKWAGSVVVSDITQSDGGKYQFKATIKT